MCIGAVVVLMTSTLNRIMVVELALPAIVPGLLVGLHYAMQLTRPGWGLRSDLRGGGRPDHRRDGGARLGRAAGGAGGGGLSRARGGGVDPVVLAYAMIGIGAAMTGTSVLAFLAAATAPNRRAAAATSSG